MTTTPNMGLVLPTNQSDVGAWGTKLNVALPLIDSHNHSPGQGVPIGADGLVIDGDVDFNGFGIDEIGRASFTPVATVSSGSTLVYVDDADDELYWRTAGGTNVKLTNGNALNVAAFTGGIIGDYTSVGAQLAYDDATGAYTFKRGTANSNSWARLRAADLRLYEYNTTESVYTALKAASGLAVSYDITFATALPGAQVLVQIGATGQLVYSNALAANQSVTVSGTGDYKHGDKVRVQIGIAGLIGTSGAISSGVTIDSVAGNVAAGGAIAYIQLLGLKAGDRVKTVQVIGSSANEPTFALHLQSGINSTSAVASTTTNTITGSNNKIVNVTTPAALATNEAHVLKMTSGAGAFDFWQIIITYDRP